MTRRAYSFTLDDEADRFVEEIVRRLHGRYGLTTDDAVARVQEFWPGMMIGGPSEVVFHDEPDVWTTRIYFGREDPAPTFLHVAATRPQVNDLVRVRALRETRRHIAAGSPKVGDLATVRGVLPGLNEDVFVVNAMDDLNQLSWEADCFRDELEVVKPWNVTR
jgi:hypothetical protein